VVVAVVFAILIVAAVGFFAWRRDRRSTSRSSYRSWYAHRWKKVDAERRRRIARAVRRGQAVEDPRDATLALEFIDAQQQLTKETFRVTRWNIRMHYVLISSVAIWLVLARPDLEQVAFAVLPLAYVLGIRFVAHRLRARVASARVKNEQLAGRFS
jgi:hypothetical protein